MDGGSLQVLERSGERGRNRTYNLLIKSQLLCQLSYAPTVGILAGRTNKNYSIRLRFFAGELTSSNQARSDTLSFTFLEQPTHHAEHCIFPTGRQDRDCR